MKGKLSLKQRKFWKKYLECNDLATAAQYAGSKGKDKNSLKVIGHQILTSLNLSIGELLDAQGLSDEMLNRVLDEGLKANRVVLASFEGKFTDIKEVPDPPTRAKYLDIASKIKGKYIEKHEITGKDGGDILLQVVPAGKGKQELNIDD